MLDHEMMFDLETLDTVPGAVVLSVGAVVWANGYIPSKGTWTWEVTEKFYRVLELDGQLTKGSVSESTLLWWMDQSDVARAEAFSRERTPIVSAFVGLKNLAVNWNISHFWASPATFDFPIWEAISPNITVPWKYNQKYDVCTVVNEANYSAKDHVLTRELPGVPHHPVYDCLWQIDLLTAARNKAGRK